MLEMVNNRKVLAGKGSLAGLGPALTWHGVSRAFVMAYDADAHSVELALQSLKEEGIRWVLYDRITAEPELADVDAAVHACISARCDCVVAIGGGSVIDCAKVVAMMAVNGGNAVAYQLEGRQVCRPPLLFVAIPTTAGTGAEATKVSVLYNREKGYKKSIYHTSMIAQAVLLDPVCTRGLPPPVIAATGMDAITHAIESYISNNATTVTRMYSLQALELLAGNLAAVYHDPSNETAWEQMLLGSYLAGCAIAAGTCLAHIVGQPVGAIYKIPHGDACSIFLLPSMRLNLDYATDDYAAVARALGVDLHGKSKREAATAGIDRLERLYEEIKAPRRLSGYLPEGQLHLSMVLDNIEMSMGHITTNPRPQTRALYEELLRMAL